MEIKILMKSKGETDEQAVYINKDKAGLSFFCNCLQGGRGKLCQHKIALVSGNRKMLFDESQEEDFKEVLNWVSQSESIRT